MDKLNKKAIVVHSGGMDSSICLASAIKDHGKDHILSLSFNYNQRHSNELERAKEICEHFGVDHYIIDIPFLSKITHNSLVDNSMEIETKEGEAPNSLVAGRNGLMVRISSIHAHSLGAHEIYMGVIEVEEANSGYRDCSRNYMNIIESSLKLDFDDQEFKIKTPLVFMTKQETMEYANDLGVLEYLLEKTITCYNGVEKIGCKNCPSCELRNEGIFQFLQGNPSFNFSYKQEVLDLHS